jgi:uncharacterized membrane protein HdeD (DUF308 family)
MRIPIKGHLIPHRRTEIVIGILLFVVGSFLLWDAFDNRGKKMPWPASAVTPW